MRSQHLSLSALRAAIWMLFKKELRLARSSPSPSSSPENWSWHPAALGPRSELQLSAASPAAAACQRCGKSSSYGLCSTSCLSVLLQGNTLRWSSAGLVLGVEAPHKAGSRWGEWRMRRVPKRPSRHRNVVPDKHQRCQMVLWTAPEL